MKKTPLRYNISSWDQLVNCMSNNSTQLRIKVAKVVKNNKLGGTIIRVFHPEFGNIFSYVIDGEGGLLTSSNPLDYELTTAQLLKELERFGFLVTFNPREHLPEAQIEYLKTVQKLGFDKIRVLDVYTYTSTGTKLMNPHIVIFNVKPNPGWMDNAYSASLDEYTKAITEGTAINLSTMSEAQRFHWDWLNYVADIQDILDDNVKE